jgi:hypothetical protein
MKDFDDGRPTVEPIEAYFSDGRGPRAIRTVLAVVFAALMLGGAGVLASMLTGCAQTDIQRHAQAALVVSATMRVAGDVMDTARAEALDRVEAAHPTDPEHDIELEREAERWRPAGQGFDTARAALLTWIESIELARIAGESDVDIAALRPFAGRVVTLYSRTAAMLRDLGVDLPVIPAMIVALLGGE